MYVVTMTGGIGSGKSEASAFFRKKGAVVLDLDQIAAHLMEPGSVMVARIAAEFGPTVVDADGAIVRDELARLAFASPDEVDRLNAIIHPAVASEVGPAITDLRLLPNPPAVVVLEVPLLVEAPVFGELADEVIAVEAPEDLRIARTVRRGMSEADARARVACQATDEERRAIADRVIDNSDSLEEFNARLEAYWSEAIQHGS